jgi:tetratricopeptide (TPR) repeat protein
MSSDQPVQQAAMLYQAGEIARAETLFGDVLAREPDNFQALKFLGKICLEKNDAKGAAAILFRALAIEPGSLTVTLDLGVALAGLERPLEAMAQFDRAVALRPNFALAYYNRAGTLSTLGRVPEALADYDRTLMLAPDFAQAHEGRAALLAEMGRLEEALAGYDAAVAHQPDYQSWYNRGNVLRDLKRPAEALASYDRALALKPDFAPAHANRAVALEDMKRLDEALAGFDAALALDPGMAGAWYNRGNVLRYQRRLDAAIADYTKAIALQPDYAGAITNRGYCRLLQGDFERGLADYEWRLRSNLDPARQLTRQNLASVAGRKVLVRYEIGLGDTIHYCRYLSFLAGRGARLMVSVQKPLGALMRSLDLECEWVDQDDPTLTYDYWVNLISLHYLLYDETKDMVWRVPYLRADPARRDLWRAKLGGDGFRVAVFWQSAGREKLFSKSFASEALKGLARMPSLRLVSVNKDAPEKLDGILYPGPDFDAGPDAFLDTAAIMTECDLVIGCDTGAAHLAGALGCPVWLALPYLPDCRWLLDRADTPLYPTMRLFRQQAPDDWNSVFAAMEKELAQRATEKT